jgi:superfamily II DNA/RNA helicase
MSVKHLVLPSHWSQRNQMLPDLVRCYGACGRTIIFTETKKDANELTNVLSEICGARALHGDIPQVGIASSTPGDLGSCIVGPLVSAAILRSA